MAHNLHELAAATGLELVGDGSLSVQRPAEPAAAGPDDLALAMSPSYEAALSATKARAGVVWADADWRALGLQAALLAPRPRVALAHLTKAFSHPTGVDPGVHPTAIIAPTAKVGVGAAVGPFVVVGERAVIGNNATISSHVSIGADAEIGDRALILQGVRVGARCRIGHDFIAQPNAVIGADGFSFEPPERGNVDAARQTGAVEDAQATAQFLRIHSLAAVEIGDDVEVGASSTIDRGTISATRIGDGTKIDNQVQIGHNVQIGQTCLICAQVGIAGSTVLGDRVVLGGKAGVADHVKIGSDVVCAASTMVANNIPARSVMMGIPAAPRHQAAEQIIALKRLPKTLKQVAEIRRKLGL